MLRTANSAGGAKMITSLKHLSGKVCNTAVQDNEGTPPPFVGKRCDDPPGL